MKSFVEASLIDLPVEYRFSSANTHGAMSSVLSREFGYLCRRYNPVALAIFCEQQPGMLQQIVVVAHAGNYPSRCKNYWDFIGRESSAAIHNLIAGKIIDGCIVPRLVNNVFAQQWMFSLARDIDMRVKDAKELV